MVRSIAGLLNRTSTVESPANPLIENQSVRSNL